MTGYILSTAASGDLRNIARYSVRTFGQHQAELYGGEFKECFTTIVENPFMGQSHDHIRPGLRRFVHKSHSIYYILRDEGVLIVRILHYRQDAWTQLKLVD